jgi:hypothetical protein
LAYSRKDLELFDKMAGEKRRAESDPRLEYIYSFLSEATSLPRNDLSVSVHEAGVVI